MTLSTYGPCHRVTREALSVMFQEMSSLGNVPSLSSGTVTSATQSPLLPFTMTERFLPLPPSCVPGR